MPVTSMEPKMLSTSRILWSALSVNDLRIVSFSCSAMPEFESSSLPAACSGRPAWGRNIIATAYISTSVRIFCLIMASSPVNLFRDRKSLVRSEFHISIQLLYSPVHALPHCGINLGVLLKFLELRHRAPIVQVHQQVNQRDLHQW